MVRRVAGGRTVTPPHDEYGAPRRRRQGTGTAPRIDGASGTRVRPATRRAQRSRAVVVRQRVTAMRILLAVDDTQL